MIKIGDVLYNDADWAKNAKFCNENNWRLIEIEPDEKGRRFKVLGPKIATQTELIQIEIESLKEKLRSTDYKAIKFAEGILTLAEYEPTREQRKKWREEINFLENSLKNV